ncbi:MAG: hypothetical protein ACEQR8_11735 [Cypionkella sp.]
MVATVTGQDEGLRSVVAKLWSRITNPGQELDNAVGGFIYPRFALAAEVSDMVAFADELHGICLAHEVELIDIDLSLPNGENESFLCLGGLLSNAQTH